jgi:hypothetical protein
MDFILLIHYQIKAYFHLKRHLKVYLEKATIRH